MIRVYPIIEPRDVLDAPEVVERLLRTGIKMLQIRGCAPRETIEAGHRIAPTARIAGVQLIINDRVDVAKILGWGVHLGQDDIPVPDARKMLGDNAVIGLSTHDEREARLTSGIDYISVGPVYGTSSKPDARDALGPEKFRRICSTIAVTRPSPAIVAIGGITLYNYRICLEHGATYVAAIGMFRDENGRLRRDAPELAEKMK